MNSDILSQIASSRPTINLFGPVWLGAAHWEMSAPGPGYRKNTIFTSNTGYPDDFLRTKRKKGVFLFVLCFPSSIVIIIYAFLSDS